MVTKGKSDRRVVRSLILIVAIIAVSCGLLVGFSQYRDSQNKKAPERAANEFLSALEIGSVADAYTQLCDATKKDFSEARFADYVKAQPGIKAHKVASIDLRTVNGASSAVVIVSITQTGGSHETHSLVLADQDDTWLVCGQPY
jgi:hypothetical protein